MAASIYTFSWWSKDIEGAIVREPSSIKVCATSYEEAKRLALQKAEKECWADSPMGPVKICEVYELNPEE